MRALCEQSAILGPFSLILPCFLKHCCCLAKAGGGVVHYASLQHPLPPLGAHMCYELGHLQLGTWCYTFRRPAAEGPGFSLPGGGGGVDRAPKN